MTRPEIVAHRGASRERPENTLAAFARAVELGADGAELDVHRTADGVIVVHHDPEIPGFGAIAGRTAADLSAVRVRGEPVPTLEAVFAATPATFRIYVELKGTGSAAGAVAVIARQTAERSAVHSFDHRMVAEAGTLTPALARGVLEVSYPVDCTAAARAVGARDLWRHRDFIDEAFVRAAHAEGRRVVAWTVNDAGLMRRLAAWGVDSICTDDVALARATLGQ